MSDTRQLIVCCDGTNNNVTGGRTDTNVIKLQESLVRDAGGTPPRLCHVPMH